MPKHTREDTVFITAPLRFSAPVPQVTAVKFRQRIPRQSDARNQMRGYMPNGGRIFEINPPVSPQTMTVTAT